MPKYIMNAVTIFLSLLLCTAAYAQAPSPLNCQGYITDDAGTPLLNPSDLQPRSDNYYLHPGFWCAVQTLGQEPTLIELALFRAIPGHRRVRLVWVTESETGSAGFVLYRATSENGDYIQINDDIIPSEGSPTQGAYYQYIDTDVQNRQTYWYKLEDINLIGWPVEHGPVRATPRFMKNKT